MEGDKYSLEFKKNDSSPKQIIKEGIQIDESMAEEFNNYYVEIGSKLASNIPDSDNQFHEFLENRNTQTLFVTPVTEEEVKDIINNLPAKKVQVLMVLQIFY